jgi:hypothetical protein
LAGVAGSVARCKAVALLSVGLASPAMKGSWASDSARSLAAGWVEVAVAGDGTVER